MKQPSLQLKHSTGKRRRYRRNPKPVAEVFGTNSLNSGSSFGVAEDQVENSHKPKFESCHSQEGDFFEMQENSRFHIKPAQRQDKFKNIQRVPIENRANFKNENLEENIIKASKLASANQPWFQSGFENNSDFKGVKVSSL